MFFVLSAGRAAGYGRILLSLLCIHDSRTPDTEYRPTVAAPPANVEAVLSGVAPGSIQTKKKHEEERAQLFEGRRCQSVINGTNIARDGDGEEKSWTEIRRRLDGRSRRSVQERLPLVEPLCNVCSNVKEVLVGSGCHLTGILLLGE